MTEKFKVEKEGTMLPVGEYEIIADDVDYQIGHKVFATLTVKKIGTNDIYHIPKGNAQLVYGICLN